MYETGKLVELNIEDVLPNRFQPRIYFNEEKLTQLAESIHKYGVIQPIVVRQINNKYEIIAGERRYKASKLAARTTIPAIIVNLTDRESEEIALLENIQRQELTPIEEAVSYKRILDMGYTTQEALAKKIGKAQSTIANKVRLLNLDDVVQEALLNGKISERHARSLLKISSRKTQREMLSRIINERLTVKRTDEEIAKLVSVSEKPTQAPPKPAVIKPEPVVNSVIPPTPVVETLFETNENRKDNFMDIDKIMREAKDINTEPAQNDINQLMMQPNGGQVVSPAGPVPAQPVQQPVQTPADDNKFVHVRPEEPTPVMSQPTQQSDVSFNNIFNPTINDLTPTTPTTPTTPSTPVPTVEPVPAVPVQEIQTPPLTEKPPVIENISPATGNTPSSIASAVSAAFAAAKEPQTIPEPVTVSQSFPQAPEPSPVEEIQNIMPIVEPISTPVQESIQNTSNEPISAPQTANIPTGDIFEELSIPSTNVQPSTIAEQTKTVSMPNNNFSEVIRLIRQCADQIESLGYVINVDEADLTGNYQVTFNINK